jgi:hypothetical protein
MLCEICKLSNEEQSKQNLYNKERESRRKKAAANIKTVKNIVQQQ